MTKDLWKWATVTDDAPLKIRFDGETTEVEGAQTLVASLVIGDRVRCHLYGLDLIIHGRYGG